MCGICGQYNFRGHRQVNCETINAMTASLTHRGPDDVGTYVRKSLGLGFRRLSIIDLEGGHQPMSDSSQNIWLVFNGEIFNYLHLREELKGYGHHFRTKSDTEVIIHGYQQWGDDVLDRLNGMFGLAIWDEKNQRLMLARDRMGIKPVYYKFDGQSLLFGSEIRAINIASTQTADVDPVSLNLFLRYRYTPAPLTLYAGIHKLAPGTRLIVQKEDWLTERYWNYSPEPFAPMPSVKQAEKDLLELYRQAVKRHLISDVPLGLLLSGGLDSGLLLALMNEHKGAIHTFTVGYGQSFSDDELIEAEQTARIFKARHSSMEISQKMFEDKLPTIAKQLEEPVAAASVVPMYFVSQLARQEVKVVLMGQGPDELFGGYRRHLGVRYGHWWRVLPRGLRQLSAFALNRAVRSQAVKRALFSLERPSRIERYQQVFSILQGNMIDGLFQADILPEGAGDEILNCWDSLPSMLESTDELGGFNFLEVRSSLPDELLLWADKLSMAHGLEVRVPYLDRDVVEYAERLSARFKIHFGSQKWIHRRICSRLLPREVIKRKKKGFAVNVVDDWFQSKSKSKLDELLMDPQSLMYKYLRSDAVQKLVTEHQNRSTDHHKILFSLMLFEEWLRH